MDLVLAVGDESKDLLLAYGEKLFGNIPVVLITSDRKHVPNEIMKPNMTSLSWGFDIEKTVKIIQDVRPQTKFEDVQDFRDRLKKLSPREHDVIRLVISGMLNKQIAATLDIAEQTVKIHRGRVMRKLQADSLAEWVRLAEKAGISALEELK